MRAASLPSLPTRRSTIPIFDDAHTRFFASFYGRLSIHALFSSRLSIDALFFPLADILFFKKGGVHALGHALLAVVPLFLLCDAEDVDCEHARPHHNRPQPQRILVYDKRPGGVGV